MTYILITSLLLLLCWLIFDHKYFLYVLACLPISIFILVGNHLYASIIALLMFFFINTNSQEPINKNQNNFKSLILALAISTLPVSAYFLPNKPVILEGSNDIFISIIIDILIVFIATSSTLLAGMNRTKGDKKIYE